MKSYICNHCGVEQVEARQDQSVIQSYTFKLQTGEWEKHDESEHVENLGWYCPDCCRELDKSIAEKIENETLK